ncbi:uncharacterized protein LTR77_001921 [Saxophila tyrrhenica]|uniref:Heterokaryon incompatibility domain-containing protein n=1 Tax=Saxophila tyrrhenica TaxID=1690608 RepID=A0AAV9PHQ6_9PEZI|nr:hypothetical protein LTR77_001921 [Saxophila tyrrhenica]
MIKLSYGRPSCIRLLDLEPGAFGLSLKATMRVVHLDTEPDYDALSYTWGSSTELRWIGVNDRYVVNITNNLFHALQRLKGEDEVRTIWIDAICEYRFAVAGDYGNSVVPGIDQSNIAERGAQVAIMASIYQNARCVDVWLGEPDPAHLGPSLFFGQQAPRGYWPTGELATDTQDGEIRKALLSAVLKTKPVWHTRVWVIQEAAHAQALYLCFGPYRQKMKKTVRDNGTGSTYGTGTYDLATALERFCSFVSVTRRSASVPSNNTVSHIIRALQGRTFAATDPRDFVYSMLSFIDPVLAHEIGSDYALKPERVFAKATFVTLRHDGHCRILGFTGADVKNTQDSLLPTWTVDFAYLMSASLPRCYLIGTPHAPDDDTPRLLHELERSDSPNITLDVAYRQLTVSALWYSEVSLVHEIHWRKANGYPGPTRSGGRREAFMLSTLLNFTRTAGLADAHTAAWTARWAAADVGTPDAATDRYADLIENWQNACKELGQDVRPRWFAKRGWLFDQLQAAFLEYPKARAFSLPDGLIGVGPMTIEERDTVVMYPRGGAHSPFLVLHWTADGWQLRGRAYVHGPQFAAFWEQRYAPAVVERDFVII